MIYSMHMNHTLESHKFFSHIAWALIIGFAIFTYMLAVRVQADIMELGDGVERLERKLDEMGEK